MDVMESAALSGSASSSAIIAAMHNSTMAALAASPTLGLESSPEVLSSSWLGFFGKLVFYILQAVSTLVFWSLKITTISVPTLIFSLLSTSLTVTMKATTLMFLTALMGAGITWVVRYRYLNMYSRLPPEPQRREPELVLFPDAAHEGAKPGLANYLDEFLSAIKIFGYLERPVFHELTRSMQTRKLIAGETLNLEEEKGFCIVVDGLVEIFVKSSHRDTIQAGNARGQPGQQRYQLLTEVRNGAPMSSLFSIMSLFTENVAFNLPGEESASTDFMEPGSLHRRTTSELPPGTPQREGMHDGFFTVTEEPEPATPSSPSKTLESGIPPISLGSSTSYKHKRPAFNKSHTTNSAHPDIIARATVDTTIAIIPASAFRRLTRVYPKATAHIVHVILSRFQRVTLATAYDYLGLTNEVLQTEKDMIDYTACQLPNILRGDALDRLKEKFSLERERVGDKDSGKGIALHNASAASRGRRASTDLRKGAALHAMSKTLPRSVVASTLAPPQKRQSIHTAGPGDLLANIQLARGSVALPTPLSHPWQPSEHPSPLAQRTFEYFSAQPRARLSIDPRESVDEDNIFRQSIMECVFHALGMPQEGNTPRQADSVEGSPRIGSFDQRRQKGAFNNNAFGFMEPFEGNTDWETESMTSGGFSIGRTPSPQQLASEMKHEAEIVFFPQGSVLVEQGERTPGIYYVIDGFLDLCIPAGDSDKDILTSSSKSLMSAMRRADSLGPQRWPPTESVNTQHPEFVPTETPDGTSRSGPERRRVGLVKPGGIAGYIGTVTSYRSFVDIVAKTDVYVGFIPRAQLERIVDRYPIVLLTMAKRLTNLLPRQLLHIDFALEWVQVEAGHVLFNKGEDSEAIYLVLNGRLRQVEDRQDGGMSLRAEFGQGDSVGELEVLTESARSGTLSAIRDTELVKFPRTLFNSLAQEHPNITIKISKIIASRMRTLIDDPMLSKDGSSESAIYKTSSSLNLRTVAIIPVRAGIPVIEFGNRLMNALTQVGGPKGATSLTQSAIMGHLGKHAFSRMGKLKLAHYLADLEEKYGLVVYVAGKLHYDLHHMTRGMMRKHLARARSMKVQNNSNFFLTASHFHHNDSLPKGRILLN